MSEQRRPFGTGRPLEEYSPLGLGHAPTKDPLTAIRGIQAGILTMEAITAILVLPVIAKVTDAVFTPGSVIYVGLLILGLIAGCAVQSRSWAMTLNLSLQVMFVLGFFIHWSMGLAGLFFLLVWVYVVWLKYSMRQRMKGGYLPAQHE